MPRVAEANPTTRVFVDLLFVFELVHELLGDLVVSLFDFGLLNRFFLIDVQLSFKIAIEHTEGFELLV